ncbi:MAG: calcium-binding protein [Planctomycetes bacterium]|nr:calcium-binding protein [Planctomycetota bacterium]
MLCNGLRIRQVIVVTAVLCLGSVAWADRTITATSGNDTLYFGVVNDGGVRKLCVLARTGSGAFSTGLYNMDTGRLTIRGEGGNDRIEAISDDEKEGVTFLDIALLTFTEIYLYGGPGNDDLWGTSKADYLYGEGGNDRLVGGQGADHLYGGADDDFLSGYGGDDVLDGGTGDDFLCGDQGNDILFGGAGNDILVGGTGNDTLDGGTGSDSSWCRTVPAPNPQAQWDDATDNPASSDCGDTTAPVSVEVQERGNPYNDWVNMASYGHGITYYHRTTSNPRLLMADAAAGAIILQSTGGDRPVVGDFDRDGRNDDVAVFRAATGTWYYDYNQDGTADATSHWAEPGDIPLAGDFDGDGQIDDVAVFRPGNCMWYFDYSHNGTTDRTSGPWGNPGDIPFAGSFDTDRKCDDVGYPLSMEHIMWNWFHEKRQRDPAWSGEAGFLGADGRLNTADSSTQGSFYDIRYDIGNVNWNPATGQATGAVQQWLKNCPGVGWGNDGDQNAGLPFVANQYSDGCNDAYPVSITIGTGGRFKSMAHLQAVIEGFINHDIPLVIAVENGGHFNVLIGYWQAGSSYYLYTAEPLDGWGRPFYGKPMRWRRMILSDDMLPNGTGTLVGMMLYGHAVRRGVGADWAQKIDRDYGSNLLCGYLR